MSSFNEPNNYNELGFIFQSTNICLNYNQTFITVFRYLCQMPEMCLNLRK